MNKQENIDTQLYNVFKQLHVWILEHIKGSIPSPCGSRISHLTNMFIIPFFL